MPDSYDLDLLPDHARVLRHVRHMDALFSSGDTEGLMEHAEVAARLVSPEVARAARLGFVRIGERLAGASSDLPACRQGEREGAVPETGGEVSVSLEDLDRDQAALELFERIAMGQLECLMEHPRCMRIMTKLDAGAWCTLRDEVKIDLMGVRAALFPDLSRSSFYSIGSRSITNDVRIAWDMHQVIRHRVAWDRAGNPPVRDSGMIQTMYNEPMGWSGLPMPGMRATRAPEPALSVAP